MTATLVVIHVNNEQYRTMAGKLVESYRLNPPGVDHRTIIVCQNGQPTDEMRQLFSAFPDLTLYHHDNSGFDIGGYLAVARMVETELMVCFGASTFVRRAGWMKRMVEAFEKHGPGFYGPTASYQVTPHLNTTGVWCPPKLLMDYGARKKIISHGDRYAFEHGDSAFWKYVHFRRGLPVKLVTWCGEYDWPEWRTPAKIYHRDDQSNCLTYFRHSLNYQLASPREKKRFEALANTITDAAFIERQPCQRPANIAI